MDTDALFDAYISYSHEDSEVVEELAQRLKNEAKLNVWLDKWELVPGQDWQKQMTRALSHAQSIVVCIGSKTPKGCFKEEIQKALSRQTEDPSFRVIPVLLPNLNDENVDEFMALRTWIDFRKGINEMAFHAMVCGIKGVASGSCSVEVMQERNPEVLRIKKKLEELKELKEAGLMDENIYAHSIAKLVDNFLSLD